MVCHPIDYDRFMSFVFYDSCHTFENIVTPGFVQDIFAVFDGEDYLEVNLGISIGHGMDVLVDVTCCNEQMYL
jgi:N-acyl-D-aspartate/D-glutamate deacylase